MSKQTMTIEELIKAGKMESSVEFPLKRYVVVNIGFFNNEDAEEETQLTLGHDPLTKSCLLLLRMNLIQSQTVSLTSTSLQLHKLTKSLKQWAIKWR